MVKLQGLAWVNGFAGEEELEARLDASLGLQQIGCVSLDVEDHITHSEPQG